jgi:hypothetical protein
LREFFCYYFNGFEISIKLCVLLNPDCFLKKKKNVGSYWDFLQTLNANADETAQKTENLSYKCVLELILQPSTAWEHQVVKTVVP